MKKTIKVVAAIIENEKEELLCALRSPDMSTSNLWEFPGGKVESDEDVYTALKRELYEELSCEVEAKNVFHENIHEYETFIIHLIAIKAILVKGTPIPSEHSKLIWLKRENLNSLKWAPADLPAVDQLISER